MGKTVYYLVSKQKPAEGKYLVEEYMIAITDDEHQPLFFSQWINGLRFNSLTSLLNIYNTEDYFIVDDCENRFYWSEFLAEIKKGRNLKGFQCNRKVFFQDSEGYFFTGEEAAW